MVSTHLKHMLVKLDHFPKGWNLKKRKPPPRYWLVKYSLYNWMVCHPSTNPQEKKLKPRSGFRHVSLGSFFWPNNSCSFGVWRKPTRPRVYLLPWGKTHGPTFRKETTFLKRQKTKARLLGTNPICTNETLVKDDVCLLNCSWLLLLLISKNT